MIKEAMLYERIKNGAVKCNLCNHRCTISDNNFGICGVRKNDKGKLYSHVYGEVIAANVDPIEKKPLYHVLPGSKAYSIATIGCNFKCGFCQNWQISQINKREGKNTGHALEPKEIVSNALAKECKSIAYTYTEPTIFFEYAYDTARIAKKRGLLNCFVTNGFMTREAIEEIAPYLDAANVDLKSFREDFYKDICGAQLKGVLESIQYMKEKGIWVEITTLVIPGENDSEKELKSIAGFIASIDNNIPWHISRFHPDYKYAEGESTPIATLRLAESAGREAGLRHIYIGNLLGESGNTICYNCSNIIIERDGYATKTTGLKGPECAKCNARLGGIYA